MENDYKKFQALMDSAYNGFTGEMSIGEFYACLDPETRGYVAIGNLNYQVCNGGFSQWHFNRYSQGYMAIVECLSSINTDESKQLSGIVKGAMRALRESENQSQDDEDDYYARDYSDPNHEFDKEFYKVAPKVMAQIESLL